MWPEKEALKFQAVWLEYLTLLHSEWPKLCGVLTILSAIGLRVKESFCFKSLCVTGAKREVGRGDL